MDAFYASIEQRDNPSLRGRPVVVGGEPSGRGVVAAASYEARAFGIHSAMPMSRAVRLCGDLVIVPPDFRKYHRVSESIFSIYRSVTPLVEPLSLDEAYLDVTENAWGEPLGMVVARRLKEAVREATSLTVSAGVAPNKFLAKVASAWKKPDGLTVIAPERVDQFLESLRVDALWGVGPKTARRLRAAGLVRLTDVRNTDLETLQGLVGSMAEWLQQLSRGVDDRRVEPHRETKSSGSENTFAQDLTDLDEIRTEVARMAERAAHWLARHGLYARTITLKVRYANFHTVTRSHSEVPSTQEAERLVARALDLVARTEAGVRPVRLLGVSVHGLGETPEPTRAVVRRPRLPFE
jgi:DNA polymerase IV